MEIEFKTIHRRLTLEHNSITQPDIWLVSTLDGDDNLALKDFLECMGVPKGTTPPPEILESWMSLHHLLETVDIIIQESTNDLGAGDIQRVGDLLEEVYLQRRNKMIPTPLKEEVLGK